MATQTTKGAWQAMAMLGPHLVAGTTEPGGPLDDNCALQIRGQEYRFLAAEDGAKAHKLFWEGEKLHHEYLYPTEDFHALSTLIS
jgi:hypothetical protein